SDPDNIQTLARTAHTLKGSAKTIGFHAIGDIACPIEDCMVAVREGRLAVTPSLVTAIAQAVAVVRGLMKRDPSRVSQLQQDVPYVTQTLERLRDGRPVDTPSSVSPQLAPAVQVATAVMDPPSAPEQGGRLTDVDTETLTDSYLLPHLDPEVLS